MSLAEEPSQENDCQEPEIQSEDDKTNESDEKDQKDKNMRMKDLLKTNRTIGPLSLLKEEVLKVFKDKETKMDNEDRPLTANKPVSSTLDLLKEDFSQFKEDVTSVFSNNSSKDKEMKSTEKMINPLSVLKEDFNHFKDVFRIGLSQQRDTAKESSTNTFKIKVLRAERTDQPFKGLFRRDQKNSQTVKETFPETRQELMDDGFRGNLSEEKDETVDADNMKDQVDELEDHELDGSEEETLESEELIPTSQEGRHNYTISAFCLGFVYRKHYFTVC